MFNYVGARFIAGNNFQSAPTPSSELNLRDRTPTFDFLAPSSDESNGFGVSNVIRADQKRFLFDLGSNNRGLERFQLEHKTNWKRNLNSKLSNCNHKMKA